MPSLKFYAGVACALIVGCKSESRTPKLPDAFAVFPNLPLPPEAEFISKAGSTDALQITLFSASQTKDVTGYYRNILSTGAWRLVSDMKKPDGSVMLYAEQKGHPLWVRIYPTSDRAGTMVELAGGVLPQGKDSVKTDHSGSQSATKKSK